MSKFLLFFMLMGYTAMAQKPRALKVVFEYDARPNQADTVFHDINTQITTADFTGRPSRSGPSEAVSFTSFSYEGGSRQTPDSLIVTLYLQVFMVKGSSWIRGSLSLSHTLEHEQLHFDITRLVGERFRQKVLNMPLTIDDYDGRIQYEYLESFREMNRLQKEFDAETGSGQQSAAQSSWKIKIRRQLAELGVQPAN